MPDLCNEELPESFVPLESVAVVKCLDEDGEPALVTRYSDGITKWEALGMLQTAADRLRRLLIDAFEDPE